jgi:hypothetical protein
MTAETEIERLRAENAALRKVLREIDEAAAEVEATEGPADDRALWTAILEARRLLCAGHETIQPAMNTETTLPTTNAAWGFWGAIAHHADPAQAWPLAMTAIAQATGCPDTAVRDFLDGRHGRQFADDVANGQVDGLALKPAIDAATKRWMDWTINRRTSRETGIPEGLPYLTGFVALYEIMADAD